LIGWNYSIISSIFREVQRDDAKNVPGTFVAFFKYGGSKRW